MIVHILPCGLSIVDNLGSDPNLSAPLGRLERWARGEAIHQREPEAWSAHFNEEVTGWLLEVRGLDATTLSAECASLFSEPRPPRWRPSKGLPPDDGPVVLLASDTPEGVLAALITGVFLERPIRFHQAPSADVGQNGAAVLDRAGMPVHVIRIPGLEPVRTETFEEAMTALGTALRWASKWQPVEAMILHVSGGYKAAIPYLVVFAEYMNSLTANVHMFCLHEGDRRGARSDPIEIFLRTPDLSADRTELKAALEGKAPPSPQHLNGFAYRGDGPYTETALGRVLSPFLDLLLR